MLEILGEWSKIIGAVASLVTMCIALVALGSWRRTLRNQRIDEAISAAFDLAGAIERYVAVRRRVSRIMPDALVATNTLVTEAFDRVLDGLRDFDRAYSVALRYRPDLPDKAVFAIAESLRFLDLETDDPNSPSIEQRAAEVIGSPRGIGSIIKRLEGNKPA